MATLTINTTTAQDTRIIAAFTDRLGETATAANVKAFLIETLRNVVHSYETAHAAEAATAVITKIDPT